MQLETSIHHWTRGEKVRRALWLVVWNTVGKHGPRSLSAWRVALLRMFGAKIGRAPLICGGVRVLMPWNLQLGDCVAIAERVDLYNFALISIGDNTCISQGTWLCTGSHDHRRSNFPLIWKPIRIGSEVWIAAEAFVHPGITIGDGVVVGARAVVANDLAPWSIYAGNPCRLLGQRKMEQDT